MLDTDSQDTTTVKPGPLKLKNPSYTAVARAFLWGGSSIAISSLRSAHKKALATAVYDGFLGFNGPG